MRCNTKWIARFLVVALNFPAIWLASKKHDVISLFLVADLVCATSVMPTFLGLQRSDWKFLTAPTEVGAVLGCVSGVVTVVVNGLINDADGGIFDYFWLRNDAICALCRSKTMVSFIVTPAVSAIMTYFFSYLDICIRGDRARKPLIPVPFDKDDHAMEESTKHVEGSSDNVEGSSDNTDEKEDEVPQQDSMKAAAAENESMGEYHSKESVYASGFADNTTMFDHTTVQDTNPY